MLLKIEIKNHDLADREVDNKCPIISIRKFTEQKGRGCLTYAAFYTYQIF